MKWTKAENTYTLMVKDKKEIRQHIKEIRTHLGDIEKIVEDCRLTGDIDEQIEKIYDALSEINFDISGGKDDV
jgi:DNA-binding FrmR family transcriptional regulator